MNLSIAAETGYNNYDFGARIYDPRIARWLSVDPLADDYVGYSPYSFAVNSPIWAMDPDGKKVYFVGGAAYNPKKGASKEGFTGGFIHLMAATLGEGGFKVAQSSYIGMIGGSLWALEFGEKPILDITPHKELRATIDEIVNDYNSLERAADDPLNLVGSSYGSVVVAQGAIAILNEDNGIDYIESVTLSASPVAKDSKLYQELLNLQKQGKIGQVIYDTPAPEDPVLGAAKNGKKSVFKLLFNKPTIASPNHPHNAQARAKNRDRKLAKKLLIEKKIEGKKGEAKAKKKL